MASKEWYRENREHVKQKNREYYLRNRDKIGNRIKQRQDEMHIAVLMLLGGQCDRCHFNDMRALQIDHVNGDGKHDKNKMGSASYYERVLKEVHTGKYQLLCANDNTIKRYEHGEHRKRVI